MSTTALKKTKLAMSILDNTLVFTMNANFEAYKRALNEHGIDLTPEHYANCATARATAIFSPPSSAAVRSLPRPYMSGRSSSTRTA